MPGSLLADRGYQVPRKGMFQLITCPNYFGEIVEWIGLAIAMQSIGAAVFALYTAANLGKCQSVIIRYEKRYSFSFSVLPLSSTSTTDCVSFFFFCCFCCRFAKSLIRVFIVQDFAGPRALSHHRWYKDKFDSYPQSRRAIIPYIL